MGLLSAGNLKVTKFSPFLTFASILLEGSIKKLGKPLKVINCYVPYSNRREFWNENVEEGLLKE